MIVELQTLQQAPASREELIQIVVNAFGDMEDPESMYDEHAARARLSTDAVHYHHWCTCIHEWFPAWHHELPKVRRYLASSEVEEP